MKTLIMVGIFLGMSMSFFVDNMFLLNRPRLACYNVMVATICGCYIYFKS